MREKEDPDDAITGVAKKYFELAESYIMEKELK
jgi:hypothetical protein